MENKEEPTTKKIPIIKPKQILMKRLPKFGSNRVVRWFVNDID